MNRGTALFMSVLMITAVIGGISYATTSDWGNNSTVNRTIIVEKFIPSNSTKENTTTVINNYNNNVSNDIINNINNVNVTTTIINSDVEKVSVTSSFGSDGLSDGISVQINATTIARPGDPVPVGALNKKLKTKMTTTSVVEESTGLIISDLFLGDAKRPCEYVNITNNNNYTAHLEGMTIQTLSGGYVFEMGDVSIQSGKTLKVYSAEKSAKDTIYSLGLPKSVTQKGGIWNDDGDTAFLVCGYDGSLISEFTK
jgi:hypothetical protein